MSDHYEPGRPGNAGYPDDAYYEDDPHQEAAGHQEAGYDRAGYAEAPHDEAGYAQAPHDEAGYDEAGYDEAGYDEAGYDEAGYDEAGYDQAGYDRGDHRVRPAGAAHARRRPPPERRRHPVLIGLAILVVLAVVAGGGFFLWAKGQITPGGAAGPVVTVVIPKGSSTSAIGSILANDGVIHSGSLFPYYVKLKGGSTLYPGTYRLAQNESYGAVLASLEAGPPIVQDRLVVPEGFTIAQMAAAVAKLPDAHITAPQFVAAADGGQARSPFEPAGATNLEGLLFPATYPVTAGQSAGLLVQQMVDAFDANAAQAGLTSGAARLGLTPYQVIIIASMVEREAKRPQDRGPIASVIDNRLKAGMPLGIDSTLLYGLHTNNAAVNPETPSPYNTRIHTGLPPTPIASPGLASLTATLNPPSTTYLYYAVTGPGGETSFASTSAEFAQIEAQCQKQGYCT